MLRKKATVNAIGYQRTGCILLAKFWGIFLEAEAIGVEAEAVCKYTAFTSLMRVNFNSGIKLT